MVAVAVAQQDLMAMAVSARALSAIQERVTLDLAEELRRATIQEAKL